jgi:outer membrane lipoprotein-sorting protein
VKKLLMAFLFVLAFVMTACVPSKPVKEEEKTLPAERLIKKIEANRRKVKTFEGSGVLNIQTSEISAKANFEVTLKKPDSVKISVYGPFGIELVHAVVSQNNFTFYDVVRNNVYKGSVKQDILKKIFKVDLTFDDLMDAFAGAVNLTDKLRQSPDGYEINPDDYVLSYKDEEAGKESIYIINAEDLAITNYKLIRLPEEILFEGTYSDFKDFESVFVPYKTVVENKENDQRVDIEYRSIKINKEVGDLSIEYPSDAEIIEW